MNRSASHPAGPGPPGQTAPERTARRGHQQPERGRSRPAVARSTCRGPRPLHPTPGSGPSSTLSTIRSDASTGSRPATYRAATPRPAHSAPRSHPEADHGDHRGQADGPSRSAPAEPGALAAPARPCGLRQHLLDQPPPSPSAVPARLASCARSVRSSKPGRRFSEPDAKPPAWPSGGLAYQLLTRVEVPVAHSHSGRGALRTRGAWSRLRDRAPRPWSARPARSLGEMDPRSGVCGPVQVGLGWSVVRSASNPRALTLCLVAERPCCVHGPSDRRRCGARSRRRPSGGGTLHLLRLPAFRKVLDPPAEAPADT